METKSSRQISERRLNHLRANAEERLKTNPRDKSAKAIAELAAALRETLEELEDRETRATYERTRDQESVPAEFVSRLAASDSPIRAWRQYRGLTLSELSGSAEVSIGHLSELERGLKAGSIGTYRRLARALDVDLDDIV